MARSSRTLVRAAALVSAVALGACRDEPDAFEPTDFAAVAPVASETLLARDREHFTRCFVRALAADPVDGASAFGVFARRAPAAEVVALVTSVRARMAELLPHAHAKILGEAAWALAQIGAVDDARAAALAGAALRPDGMGGRLTAFATLGRLGAVEEAERLAEGDLLLRSAIGFGAVIGGHHEQARRLRAGIDADASASLFVRSALHLKLVAAMGDRPALEAALADRASPDLLLDAGAIVEGGAHAGHGEVTLIGVRALAEASGASPHDKASALVGAAGTAASFGDRRAAELALAAFDALPPSARVGLELVPAVVLASLGDVAAARRRFEAGVASARARDRAMFEAGLSAMAGEWDRFPQSVPAASAVLVADVWSHALAGEIADDTRARVLASLCRKR